MCQTTEAFSLLTDLCRGGQTVTAAQLDDRERNAMRGNRSDSDLDHCAQLRIIAGWLRGGVVCRCGSDDVASKHFGDWPKECGACGVTISQDPDGEPCYFSRRAVRAAQAAFDAAPDTFNGAR